MANARDIKRKIASVQNTQKITKAMKMVSAAKMRRAVDSMNASRPYTQKIIAVVKDLASRSGSENPSVYMKEREVVKKVGVIVVASDKGLCGVFNANIIKEAYRFCEEIGKDKVSLYIVGKRVYDFFKRRPFEIKEKWTSYGAKYNAKAAETIGDMIIRAYDNEELDEVYLIFNMFKSTAAQTIRNERILPAVVEKGEVEKYPDFQYEPSVEELLTKILPLAINTVIYQAMLESAAGEHGARMVAMENATRSAGEMIKKLVLNYNKARQNAITRELLDIVNGAEALK